MPLSVFERGMVVGARCTGLSVSRTTTLLDFPVCIKNGPPPKGHPANGSPVVENGSLMRTKEADTNCAAQQTGYS